MKKALVALLIAVSVFGMLTSCGPKAEVSGDEFIIWNGAEPESLDPHLIEGVPEHRINMSIFEGLVADDPETSKPVPGVAESWSFNEDNTVITFKLRDDAVWSDGVKITAQTVKDSWIRALDPDLGGPYTWFPSMFLEGAGDYNSGEAGPEALGVKVIDDLTLEVSLIGPLPYAVEAFSHYSFGIVPIHAIEEFGDKWTSPENFVGNGPFVVKEWVPQDKVVVTKNDKYWDKEAVKLAQVTYLAVEDNNTGFNLFVNGEADWATTVPLDQMDAVKLRDDYQNSPQLGTYYYIFENKTAPFDDAKVRKALSMAIDRNTLVDKISKGGQIPAYAMVPPMAGYPGIDGFQEDVAAAQALLAEAGYPQGEGFPEFKILYNTSEGHQKIAEFIQQQWAENLGVDVTLTNMEWKTYLSERREHKFTVARAGWLGDYQDPNTFLDMFLAPDSLDGNWGGNDGRFDNARFDELIEQAATMPEGDARYDVLAEAEKIFIEDEMAVMPIYFYSSNNMIDTNKWGGWYSNTMDRHPTKGIYKK